MSKLHKQMTKGFSIMMSFLLIFSMLVPTAQAVNIEGENSVDQMIEETVEYYKSGSKSLSSWWTIVALWGAGENLTDGSWTLPSWQTTDPGLKPETFDTEHIRYIFGLLAMGEDPSNAWETNRNLYVELTAQQNENGAIGGMNKHVWAMLALDAGEKRGHDVGAWDASKKQQALMYLLDSQKADGGFALFGTESDTDITGMALLALGNYKENSAADAAIERAKEYLKQRQLDLTNGGFNSAGKWGMGDNSNSLSTSVSGLVAVGEDLLAEKWIVNDYTVVDAYKNFQMDNGGFKWKHSDRNVNGMATEQALIALTDIQIGKSVWHQIAEPNLEEKPDTDTVVIQVEPGKEFVLDENVQKDTYKPVVLDFGKFNTQVLAKVTAERGNAKLEIPMDTQITSQDWDKKIQAPTYQTTDADVENKINSKLKDEKVSNIGAHIKVGGANQIDFHQYVSLTFKDYGEQEAGFVDTTGNFKLIKKYPTADTAKVATEDVYAYKDGDNLIVKTKHFTEFLAFETKPVGPGNPGSGGGDPGVGSVTLSVEKRTMGQGDIVGTMNVLLQKGDTAFTLLKRVVDEKGISINYIGNGPTLYVQAIDGLGEFDGGPLSGWMYSVNGEYPNHSAGTYFLNDGDEMRWRYTKDLGHDIDGGYVSGEDGSKDPEKKPTQGLFKESIIGATKWMKANRDFSIYDHFVDWDVIGLARSNEGVTSAYYPAFEKYVKEQQGSFRKVTDYERMTLAVTAIGKDPRNIAGYDFIEKIYNNERITNQGTNGVIFALLALDSNNYVVPENARWTREKLLKWLLEQQNSDGGFPLAEGATSDVDITAMALQALANYQDTTGVKSATIKALDWLSKQQRIEGGFQSAGSVNSESISQVIIALSSLGIDLTDKRFKKEKGDLRTALLAFVNKDGGISHTKGDESNYMATQQGLLAFIASDRLKNVENRLYDMTDVAGKKPTITFTDVTEQTFGYEEIYRLAKKGIISGYRDGTFRPNEKLNRGQSAILFTMALRLKTVGLPVGFKDVSPSSSYFDAANATKAVGIFKGNGNGMTFGGSDVLTREQMASVLVRAFDLKATNEKVVIKDRNQLSAAHQKDVEILYQNKITMGTTSGKFDPKSSVSRVQFAVFLSRAIDDSVKK